MLGLQAERRDRQPALSMRRASWHRKNIGRTWARRQYDRASIARRLVQTSSRIHGEGLLRAYVTGSHQGRFKICDMPTLRILHPRLEASSPVYSNPLEIICERLGESARVTCRPELIEVDGVDILERLRKRKRTYG